MKNLYACLGFVQKLFCKRFMIKQLSQSDPGRLLWIILFCFGGNTGWAQIAAWDFYTKDQIAILSATTFDINLEPGSYADITRGSGATASTGINSFRTKGFENDGISLANTDYFQITLSARLGYEISLSTIDAKCNGTASFGASPGVSSQFAYSLDGINFTLIDLPSITIGATVSIPQIDVSGISALQSVPSGTTITIRYYASGQTDSGGWGFYSASAGSNGLAIGGIVNPIGVITYNTDYFRSKQNGNWATASTWESSTDNITWHVATKPPTKDANEITILTTHTVGVNNSISLDQTTIAGTLELQTGGVLNINEGAGDDITISSNGVLKITSTYTYAFSVNQSEIAVINVATGGKITIGDGSSLIGSGYENFAISSINTWHDGAVYEYNSNSPFETSNLTYFPNAGTDVPIFRVTKINGPVGGSYPTTINGLLEVNNPFTFKSSGAKIFRDGIMGTSTLTLDNSLGTTTISNPGAILGGNGLMLILKKTLNLSNGITVPSGANVTISGSAGIAKNSGSFLINGTIDITDRTISNTSGDITINGILKTSKTDGLYNPGNIASGVININDESTIEYNATADQLITSTATLNQAYYNITFSGSGIKTPNSAINVNVNGTVKITGASVIVDASNNIGPTISNATNFTMEDGRLILGTSPNIALPLMDGIYNITGGIIQYNYSGGTTQTIRSKTYQNIEITGNNVGNSNGNITLNDLGTFMVKPGGVFSINDNTITGPAGNQLVTVESGGIFKCGNNQGFNGFSSTFADNSSIHSNIETVTLMDGSTVDYVRAGDQPITNTNGIIYSNLILSGASGNKTAPTGLLTVNGNISKTGGCTFVHNNSAVIFGGSSEQIYTSAIPQMVFNNFTNNNTIGLSINDGLSVYKELLLEDNSKININADISLLSDNNNTANVAPIPTNAVINYGAGRFIVERYIPGHSKAWQFISAPTKGSTVKNAWMEGNAASGNIKPGYGTQISSNRGTWAAEGFDLFSAAGPSMKVYDPSLDSWIGITSTLNLIDNQNGYMLFVRGDRSVVFNQPATATTLRNRGKLYAPGNEAPLSIVVPANSFQSIANPYASAVDYNKIYVLSPGISDHYYIWDPQLTTYPSAYGLGAYRTIIGNVAVPSSENYTDGNIPPIQSGQAFFVENTTNNPVTVNLDESIKINGSNNIFRVGDMNKPLAQLRGNLFVLREGLPILIDGVLTQFDKSYTNELDAMDAEKLFNAGENMGILNNGRIFSIERRKMAAMNDTIFYNLHKLKQQQYQLELISTHLDELGMEAFLIDNYLQIKSSLNPVGPTLVPFNVTSDPASSAKNRFNIIFKPLAGPVAVSFVSINVYSKNTNAIIEWKVEAEHNMQGYAIERSTDGIHFTEIANQPAYNNSKDNYSYIDYLPMDEHNFYRIKSMDNTGRIEYSTVKRIYMGESKPGINVYPNPVKDGIIHLYFYKMPAGKYHINLLNLPGQLIVSEDINHQEGSMPHTFQFNKSAASGIYHLEVINPDGKKILFKVKKAN